MDRLVLEEMSYGQSVRLQGGTVSHASQIERYLTADGAAPL